MDSFCNDQPGRFIAVLLFSPLLLYKGYVYNDNFLIFFSLLLFIWDLYNIIYTKPNIIIEKKNILKPLPLTELLNNEKTGNIFIN